MTASTTTTIHDEQNFQHTSCVMAHYNLSVEEWEATPERLRMALLKEYAELDKHEQWKQLRQLQRQAAKAGKRARA